MEYEATNQARALPSRVSTRKIRNIITSLGTPETISPSEVSRMGKELDKRVKEFSFQ